MSQMKSIDVEKKLIPITTKIFNEKLSLKLAFPAYPNLHVDQIIIGYN